MFKRLTGMALLFGMAATAPPAQAAGCGLRDAVVERLKSKYSEAMTAGGTQGNAQSTTAILEIWSSESTGTFTVISTNARGVSCIVAVGRDWFQQEPLKQPPGTKG